MPPPRDTRSLPTSQLIKWVSNALNSSPGIDPDCHNTETQREWMRKQKKTAYELLKYVQAEPSNIDIENSVRLYGQFWAFAKRASPRDGEGCDVLNEELMRNAARCVNYAIEQIQYLDYQTLKTKPIYISTLINATIYSLELFGVKEWADTMEDSRLPADPAKSFVGWHQPAFTYRTTKPNPMEYWKTLETYLEDKTGRFEDNRFWYTPRFIPDTNGERLTQNIGYLTYVTPEDEQERKRIASYYQRQQTRAKRTADGRTKVTKITKNINRSDIKGAEDFCDHLLFNFLPKVRRHRLVRVWNLPKSPEHQAQFAEGHVPDTQSESSPAAELPDMKSILNFLSKDIEDLPVPAELIKIPDDFE